MSNFTYKNVLELIPGAQPRNFPEITCDPILEHCIQLRKYHRELQHLLLLTDGLKEIDDDFERKGILNSLPPVPELPELKNNSAAKKQSLNLEEIQLSEETVMNLLSKAVVRVAFILGYSVIPAELLQVLNKAISRYIQSLIAIAVELTPEEDPISLDTLEVALKYKGISGIEGLYSFYLQRIIKVHDALYSKCKHLSNDLQNNLKKPTAPCKKKLKERNNNEESSTERDKKEASLQDSISLESGERAEDLFLRRKLQRKSILLSDVESCDINNYEDLPLPSETVSTKEDISQMNSVFEPPPNDEQKSLDEVIAIKDTNSCKESDTEKGNFNDMASHCTEKSTCDSSKNQLLKRKIESNGLDILEPSDGAMSSRRVKLSRRCNATKKKSNSKLLSCVKKVEKESKYLNSISNFDMNSEFDKSKIDSISEENKNF